MNIVLAMYTANAFKEYHLPKINDSDYEITLEKNVFNVKNNIELNLDIINGIWNIYSTNDYSIIYGKKLVASLSLKPNITFGIRSALNETVLVAVFAGNERLAAQYKIDIAATKKCTIGLMNDNDIVFDANLVSRHHAEIYTENGSVFIRDLKSENGTFLNSVKIDGVKPLVYGDVVDIFGLRVFCLGHILAVIPITGKVNIGDAVKLLDLKSSGESAAPAAEKKEYFNRSPRIMKGLFEGKIEIEEPPRLAEQEERSVFMTIGPSFTMIIPMMMSFLFMFLASRSSGAQMSPYMFIGVVTAASSAIVGVIWGLVNFNKEKKKRAESEQKRFSAYGDYLRKVSDTVKEKYENNQAVLNSRYPSAELCTEYDASSVQLWNRNSNHADFLYHRVGLGKLDFQGEIIVPKEKFSETTDELAQRPAMIKEKYSVLENVPVGVDLAKYRLIGIVGGKEKKGAIDFVKSLIVQISACNCYTDVKLALVLDDKNPNCADLGFAKWLPHIWGEEKKERYFALNKEEASDVFYNLANILRIRSEQSENAYGENQIVKPHYVLIVENAEYLDGELIAKYVYDNKEAFALTTILLSETYEDLPNTCECIVFNIDGAKGIYTPQSMGNLGNDVVFDSVDSAKCEKYARRISGLEVNETETGGEIANSLSFLDMYHVEKIEDLGIVDRWRKNRTYQSMKALVGQKAGGADCYLDIHEKYHGPHGLVAGTTGSGKSETLQTYILSLAVNFSPNDIAFFIIDFKGGGMANLFSSLPHMAGQISNLSGNQVRRAMVSIKSENLRRQRIFTENGVNNINSYTRLYKNNEVQVAVPHLFIIIDEFAELKREEPEFMKELISVAQVGRSLGVHLILATQKPSGTVDDNIRSNSKFKLCLRVQSRQDSNDMISKPDAAYLTQAGRCFLQVGNDEIFELFQSGWSGAVYDEKMIGLQTGIAGLIVNTGKAVMTSNRTLMKKKAEINQKYLEQILACILEAAQETGFDLNAIAKPEAESGGFLQAVFERIKGSGLDYANNTNNKNAIVNFIKLYNSFSEYQGAEIFKNVFESAKRFNIKLPEMKEKTQLDAVVEYICRVSEENGYPAADKLWLPVLPERMYLSDLKAESGIAEKREIKATVGLCDDPVNQAQFPYTVDLTENGHLCVFGGALSGKSTFLQTLAFELMRKYSPEQVNFYALDFSNHMLQAFEEAPHFGGVMYETDLNLIAKFFYMIEKILSERKKLIRGSSFSQFIKNSNQICPAIIIMIDNYAAFKEKTEGLYDDFIMELSRDGAGFGVYLVVSAGGIGISDLPAKVADNIKTAVAFDMGDKIKYSEALGVHRLEILPEENIKGRGLVVVRGEPLEFQAALCLESKEDYERSERIKDVCRSLNERNVGYRAMQIPSIPDNPTWKTLSENATFKEKIADTHMLPFAYDKETADIVSLNLQDCFCSIISGSSRTGRTNTLKIMAAAAKMKQAKVVLIDKEDMSLKAFAEKYCDTYISTKQEMFDFLKALLPDFKARNTVKREVIQNGGEDSEVFAKMLQFEQIFIFIADVEAFNKLIYTYDTSIGDMHGFMENILDKGANHNIFIVADLPYEQYNQAMAKNTFALMAGYKKGIYMGGNLTNQRLFDFSALPFSIQSKSMKLGEGVITATINSDVAQIVVPSAKGML